MSENANENKKRHSLEHYLQILKKKIKKPKSTPIPPPQKPEKPPKPHTEPQKTPILPIITDPTCHKGDYRFFIDRRRSSYYPSLKNNEWLYKSIKEYYKLVSIDSQNKTITFQKITPNIKLVEYRAKRPTTNYKKTSSNVPSPDYLLQTKHTKRFNRYDPMKTLRLRRNRFLKPCGQKRIKSNKNK